MTSDLSNDEILILQAMWDAKALGNHGIGIDRLAGRMSNVSKTSASEMLRVLQARGLITANREGTDRFGLSPLGAAFVRQLQDRQLGDLTRAL